MEFPYPRMANYLIIKRHRTKRYLVKNTLTNVSFLMDAKDFFFLRFLNGFRDPYDYQRLEKEEIERDLEKFARCNLIRIDTQVMPGMNTLYIPKKNRASTLFPMLINVLLLCSFLPVLFYGIYALRQHLLIVNTNSYYILGGVLGFILSSFVHEIGHAIACLAYGGYFFELGFLTNLLPGFYALMDYSNVERRLRRVQILAAGIEMNLLVAGIGFFLATKIPVISGLLFWLAAPNIAFAILNFCAMGRFDGSAMMKELIGVDSNTFFELLNGKTNMHGKRNRASGYVAILVSIAVLISRLIIPLFFLAEILAILR